MEVLIGVGFLSSFIIGLILGFIGKHFCKMRVVQDMIEYRHVLDQYSERQDNTLE